MKKLFSTSLLAMLCCIVNLSFAQNDIPTRKQKNESGHSNFQIPKFDIEEDLQLMTLLTNALHKDGLIDKTKSYKLQIKDGEFSINDKRQTREVTDKYRKYFRKDTTDNYTINSPGDRSESNHSETRNDKPKRTLSYSELDIKFDGVQYQKYLEKMNLLIDGLDKDGLIDKKKPYKLEVKASELYINGNKQPTEVSDKFRKYFQSNNYALIND